MIMYEYGAFGSFFLVDYARDPSKGNIWEQIAHKIIGVPKTEYWWPEYKRWRDLIKEGRL